MKRATEVGAVAVMAKPALPEQVEAAIVKALARKRAISDREIGSAPRGSAAPRASSRPKR